MSHRAELPAFRLTTDGRFKLTEDFVWPLPWRSGVYVHIPKGYITNFASVPPGLRWAVSPIDPSILVPSLVHDWLVQEYDWPSLDYPQPMLYLTAGKQPVPVESIQWDTAAGILRKSMQWYGASKFKRNAVYLGVRLWGFLRDATRV